MPPLTLTSDLVFIRRDSEDFEQARSSLAAPDVRTDALRCLTIGGGLSACALSGSEPTEQRAQSDAWIGFAESRQRKTKGQNCPPPHHGRQRA